MHFGISEKPTSHCISLCNNASIICKVSEEIAGEKSENCRWRPSHCRLTPPPQGTTANIRINLILPESRLIGLHTRYNVSRSNFRGGLRKTHDLSNRVCNDCCSRSSKVVDFGTNQEGACDFQLVIKSSHGHVLTVSETQ